MCCNKHDASCFLAYLLSSFMLVSVEYFTVIAVRELFYSIDKKTGVKLHVKDSHVLISSSALADSIQYNTIQYNTSLITDSFVCVGFVLFFIQTFSLLKASALAFFSSFMRESAYLKRLPNAELNTLYGIVRYCSMPLFFCCFFFIVPIPRP